MKKKTDYKTRRAKQVKQIITMLEKKKEERK
jgi:hypothetical protein